MSAPTPDDVGSVGMLGGLIKSFFLMRPVTAMLGGSMLGIGIALADTMDPSRLVTVNTELGQGALQLGDVTLPGAMITLAYLLGKWQPKITIEVCHKVDESTTRAISEKIDDLIEERRKR